jgi:hypothetical protein
VVVVAERRDAGSGNGKAKSNGQRRAQRTSPAELARAAARELADLVGREPEGVVSLERTDDGWRVGVEVVETRRVPDTADVLAEYSVDVDDKGALVGYRRTRRYARGRTGDQS